jgi:hypothetical protein
MTQGVDCVYQDSQQPKIEHNTRILLERIQLLEDRILSSTAASANTTAYNGDSSQAANHKKRQRVPSHGESHAVPESNAAREAPEGESQIPIPLSHTANANHVIDWPVVRQLLANSDLRLPQHIKAGDIESTGATDVFFLNEESSTSGLPPQSWSLFDRRPDDATIEEYHGLVFTYFENVNVFYPLLSFDTVVQTLETLISTSESDSLRSSVSAASYCLVQLVLCLGRFVQSGLGQVRLDRNGEANSHENSHDSSDDQLWGKAKLLLGSISSDASLEAAQCSMLARYVDPAQSSAHAALTLASYSIYMGAKGLVSQSFHWAHAAAVKCEAIAKR